MKTCGLCGKYTDGYETLVVCPRCEDNGPPYGEELARKDAEIAAMITAMTSAITILEHPKMDGGEKRKAIEVLKTAQRKAIGGQQK